MPIFRAARKIVDGFSSLCSHIAMWGVFVMMLLVVTDVTLRAFAGRSTLIADEMGGYLLVLIAYLAMGETFKLGRHIQVDIVSRRLPARLRGWCDVLLTFIGLLALIVVIWRVVIMVYHSYTGNVIIPGVFLTPVYIPQTLVIIGLLVLALQCIAGLVSSIAVLRVSAAPQAIEKSAELFNE